jgi:hypothetical protein
MDEVTIIIGPKNFENSKILEKILGESASNKPLLNQPIKDLHIIKKYKNKIINIQEIT